jgi:hypothetical protein
MDTAVDVRLNDNLMGEQSVSNCPYRVEKLVEDQGLDCGFGREDHRVLCEIGSRSQGLMEEIETPSHELGNFLPSGGGGSTWI